MFVLRLSAHLTMLPFNSGDSVTLRVLLKLGALAPSAVSVYTPLVIVLRAPLAPIDTNPSFPVRREPTLSTEILMLVQYR